MLLLDAPIEKLAYVGPRNAPRLKKLGIKNVRDLLWHFPARYEDYSLKITIDQIAHKGELVSIVGKITNIETTAAWRRRMTITDATIEDQTGIIHAVWFNQPYLERTLIPETYISLSGKTALDKRGLYLSGPMYEKLGANPIHTGRLVPIYPETEGVSSKYLRLLVNRVLRQISKLSDPLPKNLIEKYKFPELGKAIQEIHFPQTPEQANYARQRFAFEEILLFQLKSLLDRRQLQTLKAPPIKFNKDLIGKFVKNLPFELTNDQRLATYEILKDLEKNYPMNRLLNGDVGSGKTVVALIAGYQTVMAGLQVVFMAPTEILAKQHFGSLRSLSAGTNLKIGLLTGNEARQWPTDEITNEKIGKKLMQKKIASGEIQMIIGTHAVIQKDVKFKNLGLVVIDEQHRFGVQQRMKLVKQDAVPHLLSMTATPIPRTLALTIYGDLDISLLKEKPKGRQEIITRVVSHSKRQSAYKFIGDEIKKGRQAFVICPRIELSKSKEEQISLKSNVVPRNTRDKPISQARLVWAEVKAVTDEYEKLARNIFPHLNVAMLHGKLKPKEKDEIMNKFSAKGAAPAGGQGFASGGKNDSCDILVSTSVVEVGVDVPNATIMMIESAERFGLAQLHQFRGRVGRGQHQSYCLLFTSDEQSVTQRLKAMEKTNDGFALAEADLKIRGPGEFIGTRQSGIPDLAMASLTDIELIKKARLEAKLLLKDDPTLQKYPTLLTRLSEMQKMVHFE